MQFMKLTKSLWATCVLLATGFGFALQTGPVEAAESSFNGFTPEYTAPGHYEWGVLDVGKPMFVDRDYVFDSIPGAYKLLPQLRTAKDDRSSTGKSFVEFNSNVPLTVYVAHDDKIVNKPEWLSDWKDTGDDLVRRSIYQKTYPAGQVALGGNTTDGDSSGSMYMVFVGPLQQLSEKPQQLSEKPVVLYQFNETNGDRVHDSSGNGDPLDLVISNPGSVSWVQNGGLMVRQPVLISSITSADKVSKLITRSGEISIEAWIAPANVNQEGPARIVTLSEDYHNRNFTLGQKNSTYDIRVRSTSTGSNGTKSFTTPSGTVVPRLSHVIFTRDTKGISRLYIDGVLTRIENQQSTLDQTWDASYRFALANEMNGGRPWLGMFRKVAIYDHVIDSEEVVSKYSNGYQSVTSQADTQSSTTTTSQAVNTVPTILDSPDTSKVSLDPVTDPVINDQTQTKPTTGSVELSWVAPQARADGVSLSLGEISGYKVYYAKTTEASLHSIDLTSVAETSVVIEDLPAGTYGFSVTAIDTGGRESNKSNTISRTIN